MSSRENNNVLPSEVNNNNNLQQPVSTSDEPQQQLQKPPQDDPKECSVMEDDTGNLKEIIDSEFKVIGTGDLWGKLISLNPSFQSIEIKQNSIQIGRSVSENNDIIFTSPTVSAKHCKIYRDPTAKSGNVVFVDDFSINGTYINSKIIGKGSKILIESGCEISVTKGTEKISYIYQDCFEEQRETEEGGPQKKYNLRDVLGTENFATFRLGAEKETGIKLEEGNSPMSFVRYSLPIIPFIFLSIYIKNHLQ